MSVMNPTVQEQKCTEQKPHTQTATRKKNRGGRASHGSRTDKLVKGFDMIHTPNQSSASAPDVDDPEAFPALY